MRLRESLELPRLHSTHTHTHSCKREREAKLIVARIVALACLAAAAGGDEQRKTTDSMGQVLRYVDPEKSRFVYVWRERMLNKVNKPFALYLFFFIYMQTFSLYLLRYVCVCVLAVALFAHAERKGKNHKNTRTQNTRALCKKKRGWHVYTIHLYIAFYIHAAAATQKSRDKFFI